MIEVPDEDKKKVEVIPASKELQQKAGTGNISPELVQKSQKILDNNTVDFVPEAQERLAKLAAASAAAKANPQGNHKALLQEMVRPVMGMKADAAMFGYPLFSEITAGLLNFLEALNHIDADVLQIVDAHHRTLAALVALKMKGSGGDNGAKFRKELQDLLQRYLSKHKE